MNKITYYVEKISSYFKVDDKRGVTAIEYGLIAALISVVIVGSATSTGSALNKMFSKIATQMGTAQDALGK
ncbi:Flp family type IVb pilin (plasmid) [Acetobacter orientalis]|uniref:Flp family type IVb pilin n=1 Tax=Acetobacter orientalis TaxID=146474 RepID=UPI00386D9188